MEINLIFQSGKIRKDKSTLSHCLTKIIGQILVSLVLVLIVLVLLFVLLNKTTLNLIKQIALSKTKLYRRSRAVLLKLQNKNV